jgi:hypothetical protein
MTALLDRDIPAVDVSTLAATLQQCDVLQRERLVAGDDVGEMDEDLARLQRLLVALTRG